MDIDFQQKMAAKSTEDLLRLIEERQKYVPEAINAAIAELRNRGHVFSDQELENIDIDIQKKIDISEGQVQAGYTYDNEMSIFPNNATIQYYSKRTIIGFSIFFGTIVGAVLMVINVRKNRQHTALTIVFGVLYAALIYYVGSLIGRSSLTILLNGIGGYFITGVLWPKFIGQQIQYKAREIWLPLVICIILFLAFFYIVYNMRIGIS